MLSRLRSFLTAWTRRERFEDALDVEVRFHIDAYTHDLQREQTVFTNIAAHRDFRVHVTHGGRTIYGLGLQVSGSYFPVLGLAPAAGRLLGPEVDESVGGHPIAVLGHDFWQIELDLSTLFAALTLRLSGIGLYGVLASAVVRSTREIGLRLALGARRSSVAFLPGREGATLLIAGVAVGGFLAFAGGQALRGVLFGVTATDPSTMAGSILVIVAAALLALVARHALILGHGHGFTARNR